MKRVLIANAVIFALLSVLLIFFFSNSYGNYVGDVDVSFGNAPEGTAYVDILMKLDESNDNYAPKRAVPKYCIETRHFTESGYKPPVYEKLNIDEKSGIVRYNKDGYMSILSHYPIGADYIIYDKQHCTDGSINGYSAKISADIRSPFWELERTYGKFRAAYVDENGNVLGIASKMKKRYAGNDGESFRADGDTLYFSLSGDSPIKNGLKYAAVAEIPVLLVSLFVLLMVRYVQRSKEINAEMRKKKSDE